MIERQFRYIMFDYFVATIFLVCPKLRFDLGLVVFFFSHKRVVLVLLNRNQNKTFTKRNARNRFYITTWHVSSFKIVAFKCNGYRFTADRTDLISHFNRFQIDLWMILLTLVSREKMEHGI